MSHNSTKKTIHDAHIVETLYNFWAETSKRLGNETTISGVKSGYYLIVGSSLIRVGVMDRGTGPVH